MHPVEASADAALVAIMTSDGEVLGTGFVIDDDGTVLTCHHVVDGLPSVRMCGAGGSLCDVTNAAIVGAAEVDLALIRTSARIGTPLPLAVEALGATEYWTKGFHRLSAAIRTAFPVYGRLIGRTSVAYDTSTASYSINDVLVLRDDSIEPGLSGAPVLEPESGVVIGVVSTKLSGKSGGGGFAIPIGHAFSNLELARAARRNQATVPAFGAYLNTPAARELCDAITETELENLAQLRHVDLSRRVPRKVTEAAISEFLEKDSPVFALIGPSGVGKSTEIAALAQRLPGRGLLLRGSAFSREAPGGLGEAILAALKRASGRRPLPDDADQLIARALSADTGLIVLVDALNEAPFSGREFEEWVAGTRSWLRETGGRLIVSCRDELWADLVGRSLSAKLDEREPIVTPIGGFDDDEYRAATRAYGLPASTDMPILRLPLMLSLSVRYRIESDQDAATGVSLNHAIEKYIVEAARSLVARATGPPLSSAVIRNRLTEIAAYMWEKDADVIGMAAVIEIVGGPAMVDALVLEGLMSIAPSGYRFVYDDVSDWLQAQRLDLARELSSIVNDPEYVWRRMGPVAAALREVERREGTAALSELLMRLVQDASEVDGQAFQLLQDTLAKVAGAEPYIEVLDLMVAREISGASSGNEIAGRFLARRSVGFWRSVPVTLPQRLRLLRRLCQLDSYYQWRPKDWVNSPGWPTKIGALHLYSALAFDQVRQDPPAGVAELLSWLGDGTELRGGEATVADVALGILYKLRFSHADLVWRALLDAGDEGNTLVRRLAMDDPAFLADMISTDTGNHHSDRLVITAAYRMGDMVVAPERPRAVYQEVARRYKGGIDENLQGPALNILIEGSDGSAYVGAAIEAYRKGVPGVDEWTLVSAAAKDDNGVSLPVIVETLNGGGERRETALAALARSTDTKLNEFGDRAVRRYLEESGRADYPIYRYIEDRLWASHAATVDLLEAIRLAITVPGELGKVALMYPLTSVKGLADSAQRAVLMQSFIDSINDPDDLYDAGSTLIHALTTEPQTPGNFDLLRDVLARMEASSADRLLASEAYFTVSEFTEILADWLVSGTIAPAGRYTSELKALLQSGKSPRAAIEQVFRLGGEDD